MNRNEIVVLQKMKSKLVNEVNNLQLKIDLLDQLIAGDTVLEEAELPVLHEKPISRPSKKSTTPKRTRNKSPDSIISRIETVITDNPELEFSTSELAAELKEHWKKEYAKKDNLMSVISAIMTAKDTVKAGWFTKTKKAGKWYFKAATSAPMKKTA